MSTELAWAAGFFDGEGSTFVCREKRRGHSGKPRSNDKPYIVTSPEMSISQVRREPLDRFAAAVAAGKVSGPYKQKTINSQPYFRWCTAGRPIVSKVLINLWPYLSRPKQDQALEVWQYLAEHIKPKSPKLQELPNVN